VLKYRELSEGDVSLSVGSRWEGLYAWNWLPNIFLDPRNPLKFAKMTLHEPPPELAERYLEGDGSALKAFEKFYGEVKGVEFEISDIPQAMERARKRRLAPQTLWKVIEEHITDRAIEKISKELRESGAGLDRDVLLKKFAASVTSVGVRASELVVHPYNVRVVLHNEDSAKHFLRLSYDGDLATPLLVVPVAPEDERLKELHLKMFEMIEKKIENEAQKNEELQRLIKQKGIGEAMRGITGYRKLMREDGEILFAEDDPLRQITGVKKPKYFIIDGQLRALAMWLNLSQGRDEADEAYVWIIDDAEPATVAYLSMVLNTGLREVNNIEFRSFLAIAGRWNRVTFTRFAERIGSLVMRNKIKDIDVGTLVPAHSFALTEDVTRVRGLLEPPQLTAREEEGKREERRWERREEPAVKEAMRPAVSEAQRTAQTLSYAPAQPQPSAQMPISPPAQPSREEVLKSGALPGYVEAKVPFDVRVLAAYLDMYRNILLLGKEGEVDMEVVKMEVATDFHAQTVNMRELLKGRLKKMVGHIYYLALEEKAVEVDGFRTKDSAILPFYVVDVVQGKPVLAACPDCRIPIPLSPQICPNCLKLITDEKVLLFPCKFTYRPEVR
jgi:hypothetical protein